MLKENIRTKATQLHREFALRHLEYTKKNYKNLIMQSPLPQEPVRVVQMGLPQKFTLEIDLRFSKTRIISELKKIISDGKKGEITESWEWDGWDGPEIEFFTLRRKWLKEKELHSHYFKRVRDQDFNLELYERYLQVWDLRERQKKSMKDIVDELPYITDKFMARDYYNAAKRCVLEGPPFGPPFK